MKANWYDIPTMVIYRDDEKEECVGIAYHDEVICLCCGGIAELEEITIVRELDWVDVSREV